MKNLFTIIVTALLTAGLLIWGYAVLNWDPSDFNNLNLFSFGADEWRPNVLDFDELPRWDLEDTTGERWEKVEKKEWSESTGMFCNENENPIQDPITGEIECVAADVVETECLRLDGDVYDLWDIKTQYKPVILWDEEAEELNQTCKTAEFTCVNGIYVSDVEDALEYNRTECITIDITKDTEVTCNFDGELYKPGEAVYQFLRPKVEKTIECEYVWFYCNGHGERRSNFDDSVWEWEKCYFTESFDDRFIDEYAESLIQEWVLEKNEAGELILTSTFEVQAEWVSCETPWWEEVNHGQSVLSFEDETGAFEEECVVRTSECINGAWEEFEPYTFPTCKNDIPDSCLINGYELYHDTTERFYAKGSYVDGTRECDSQERECVNGELSGDEGYIYIECNPPVAAAPQRAVAPKPAAKYDAGQASCPSPYVGGGASWKADQTWVWYTSASVPFGSECQAVNLVCKFGTIRVWGVSSYGGSVWANYHTSCSKWSPTGCSSACGDVAHGGSLTTYNFASLPYDPNVSSCNGVANVTTVSSCSNGVLSPAPTGNCSCTIAAPAWCANGMSHGQTITRYNDPGCSADQFGNELDGWENSRCQCKYGSITCTNGKLSKTANYPGDGYPQGSCG